jgi:hypothetical protein
LLLEESSRLFSAKLLTRDEAGLQQYRQLPELLRKRD